MTWQLNSKEFEAVIALSETQRYQHFLKKVADWDELWSLQGEDGWVLAGERTGREVVPIWPHAKYAVVCAVGQWEDTHPSAITLSLWLDKWIPGLIRDNRLVAVFPTLDMGGMVVTPEQLQHDLEVEMSMVIDDD